MATERRIDGTTGDLPGCLDEQEAVDFAAGMLAAHRAAGVEAHLATCDRCSLLVAAAAPHVAAPPTAPSERRTVEIDAVPPRPPPRRGRDRPVLDPGTLLDDTYRVVGFLGRGAMGDVYEVRHARLAGRYAAKLLSPDLVDNQQAFSRFRREAMIASGLSHPNIVHVIDFRDLSDGRPCLVMEFLDGADLAQEMAAGPLPLDRTLHLVRQIVSALSALHGLRIIHRDLKPQNILVLPGRDGEPERVKLVDFGLAKRSKSSLVVTHDKTLLGTPQYMAPEQALGNSDTLGPEADQFSLAAIVYEMLGGVHPFGAEVLSAVLYKIVHEPPAPLATLAPGVPAHVVAAIERGLAKTPEGRFPSVKAFLHGLEGEGAVARSPTPTPAPVAVAGEPRRSSARRRVLAGLGALAGLAGLAAGVRALVSRPEGPRPAPVSASPAPGPAVAPRPPAPPPSPPPDPAAAAPSAVPAPAPTEAPPAPTNLPSASASVSPSVPAPRRHGPRPRSAAAEPREKTPSLPTAAPPAEVAPPPAAAPPPPRLIEKL